MMWDDIDKTSSWENVEEIIKDSSILSTNHSFCRWFLRWHESKIRFRGRLKNCTWKIIETWNDHFFFYWKRFSFVYVDLLFQWLTKSNKVKRREPKRIKITSTICIFFATPIPSKFPESSFTLGWLGIPAVKYRPFTGRNPDVNHIGISKEGASVWLEFLVSRVKLYPTKCINFHAKPPWITNHTLKMNLFLMCIWKFSVSGHSGKKPSILMNILLL